MRLATATLALVLAVLVGAPAGAQELGSYVTTNESFRGDGIGGTGQLGAVSGWSPAWSPAIVAWWVADLGVTLNGSNVSAWSSQAGGRNATQVSAGKQPAYTGSSATYGGHAMVSFVTASSQNLVDTAAITLAQPDTFYVVGRSTSAAGNYAFIDASAGTIQACYSASGSQDAAMYGGSILGSGAVVSTASVMAYAFSGASSAIYVKNFTSTAASGNANTNGMGTIAIGGANRGAGFLTGEIAEVVLTSTLDDVFFRGRMFTYEGNRYQVPAQ